jgi:hypothetical protein
VAAADLDRNESITAIAGTGAPAKEHDCL